MNELKLNVMRLPLETGDLAIRKEETMKVLKAVLLFLVVCAAAYPQTKDLGLGAFANEKGPIMLAVDASVVDQELSSPYLMFILYMAAEKEGEEMTVSRDNVVMICQGKEYKMPSIKELQKNYNAQIRDINLYRHLGKEGIVSSWIRFYKFPRGYDFFPALTLHAPLPVDEGSLDDFIGFRTKAYFKNPGLKKGDRLTIKVWDKKNPQITGECDVVIQ